MACILKELMSCVIYLSSFQDHWKLKPQCPSHALSLAKRHCGKREAVQDGHSEGGVGED
jgi:hypothetical protein